MSSSPTPQSSSHMGSEVVRLFNRARQFTEERLGTAEKTQLDRQYEYLSARTDDIRNGTERILRQTNAVLEPNPNRRLETAMYDTLQRRPASTRRTELELFGSVMLDAASLIGPDSKYAQALTKCGQGQIKVGEEQCQFAAMVSNEFVRPLNVFLNGEIKSVASEKRVLQKLRLDLDSLKNKARKTSVDPQRIQADLDKTQRDFDRQYEVTKLLLESVQKQNEDLIHHLTSLVDIQYRHYSNCARIMADLSRELRCMAGEEPPQYDELPIGEHGVSSPISTQPAAVKIPAAASAAGGSADGWSEKITARVLCDYDAMDATEMSLVAEEIVLVQKLPSLGPNWVIAEKNGKTGKVPADYLDLE